MLLIFTGTVDPSGEVPMIGIPPFAHPDQESVKNTLGAIFMLNFFVFFSTTFPTVGVFQIERPIFLREQANMMYGVFPYYLTKLLIDIPLLILTPLIIQAITYYPVGFYRNWDAYLYFYLSLELLVQCGASLGLAISASSPDLATATFIAPAVMMPL